MIIKIENDVPVGHPIVEDNFRQLFPNLALPLVLSPDIVEPLGYGMYDFSQRPEVRWDQKLVEAAPVKNEWGIWRQQWQVVDASPAEVATLADQQRTRFLRQIDAQVDEIYWSVIGNRAAEYEQAERDAKAYADGGYSGPAPANVTAWATAKGWSNQQAADDILLQAAQWRGAQTQIRAQRLLRKEQIRVAVSVDAMETIMAGWQQFIAAVKAQLSA